MSIAACEKVSHVLVAEVRHILLDPVTTVGNMPGERGEREREGGEERNGALHGEVAANTVVTISHLLLKKQVTISLHNQKFRWPLKISAGSMHFIYTGRPLRANQLEISVEKRL